MEEINYTVRIFDKASESKWDSFVDSSVNGTFLQTRRFLNYHPESRFVDHSLEVYDLKNNLVAVCPACLINDSGKKVLYSHAGSTFGGIVLSQKICNLSRTIEIINAVEKHCADCGIEKIVLKQTSPIFSRKADDMIAFALCHSGFEAHNDLNLFIDFSDYKENILSNFSQGKRTNVNNCLRSGMTYRRLEDPSEIKTFYDILCQTLEKYNRAPVHSFEELLLLKNNVIMDECEFFGAFLDGKMIAGSMMFYFKNASTAHTQYLCALHEYDTLSAMTFMYYAMIKHSIESGFKRISFGIATEDGGSVINNGLMTSKESFGAIHSINGTFIKNLAV